MPAATVVPARKRAAALIVAIWVIGLLSLLVGSFAFQAHLEARITSYYRKRLQAETLAKAGIERSHALLINSLEAKQRLGAEPTAEEQEKPFWQEARRLARGTPVKLVDQLGPGRIILEIVHEPARLNINRLSETDWAHILELCHVPESLWDGLIDSFFDWIQPLDDPRLDGAGPDYYLNLDPPYRPRGTDIASIDELMMIKGFTREIVHGGIHPDALPDDPLMTGLADLFTTVGDGKINVNAASKRVLMALPGVDELTAQDIVHERDGTFLEEWQRNDAAFSGPEDFFRRFEGLATELKDRIVTDAQVYRIISSGEVDGVERKISATVDFSRRGLSIKRWMESDDYWH